MKQIDRVLIIGGGIGGMCAAICLARNGCDVELVEIKQDWSMLGAGLTLNGPTLASFDRMGLLDRFLEFGAIRGPRPGLPESELAVGGILRPVLHAILEKELHRVDVRVKVGVTFSAIEHGVETTRVTFSDHSSGNYDLVIGADGIASEVRQTLFPKAPQPRFTGQGCWRAVLPRPHGFDGALFGKHRTVGFTPVSQTEMYIFLLQSLPDNPWIPPEQWPDRFIALVRDYHDIPEVRELTADLGAHSQINYRPLEWLFVPAPWHKGRTMLIGDAVHATTPHTAYGAGLAIEDAVVLSDLIATGQPLEDVFATFMKRRCDRSRAVVETAVAIGQFQLHPGSPEELKAIVDAAHAAVAIPAYG